MSRERLSHRCASPKLKFSRETFVKREDNGCEETTDIFFFSFLDFGLISCTGKDGLRQRCQQILSPEKDDTIARETEAPSLLLPFLPSIHSP